MIFLWVNAPLLLYFAIMAIVFRKTLKKKWAAWRRKRRQMVLQECSLGLIVSEEFELRERPDGAWALRHRGSSTCELLLEPDQTAVVLKLLQRVADYGKCRTDDVKDHP